MRIISGKFKGKKIQFLKNTFTRPLKDSVRENIFNILNHSNEINTRVKDSYILDAYSGIGSFGLECISRGACKVTFVEQDENALKKLQKNLIELSILNQCKIIKSKMEDLNFSNQKEKFNIFFFDPPFSDKNFIKNLEKIKKKEIHENNHIIVIHREIKTKETFGSYFQKVATRVYGRSKIIFGKFN